MCLLFARAPPPPKPPLPSSRLPVTILHEEVVYAFDELIYLFISYELLLMTQMRDNEVYLQTYKVCKYVLINENN